MSAFQFEPIGFITSCFHEKFGIPRQAGLAPAARAALELIPPCAHPEAVRGLEGFSHLWLLFIFHGITAGHWHPTVRPPRLGGNQRSGVFATRSTFRPNPIGLSAVKLEQISTNGGHITLHLSGVDLLDGTPVLDIKPYLPYADCITTATGGFATQAPVINPVQFSPEATAFLAAQPDKKSCSELHDLIIQVLSQDPRPAYKKDDQHARKYGMRLFDYDIHWETQGNVVYVTEIVKTGIKKNGL